MIIKSLDLKSANDMLPKRDIDGNKGTFGKVLLICGSRNMVGCCVLATEGTLRSGAGLVTLASFAILIIFKKLNNQLIKFLYFIANIQFYFLFSTSISTIFINKIVILF